MTPFDRALSIVTEYEAAGETSAARMLLLTRIEDLCRAQEELAAARAALVSEQVNRINAAAREPPCSRGRGDDAPA